MDAFGIKGDEPKQVAKRLGIEWPPEYWAVLKTTRTGALELSVLLITSNEIVYGYMRLPLAGAKAAVNTSADTSLAQGWVAKEPSHTPQLLLTIEGRGDPIVIAMRADNEPVARSAAATINALAGRARSSSSTTENSIPERIGMLAALRDHGIITDQEFNAETSDLLSASGAP
jgi:hypothetical protein